MCPLMQTGERQSNINIADGRKSSVILESEAAMMDQVNRAKGMPFLLFYLLIIFIQCKLRCLQSC